MTSRSYSAVPLKVSVKGTGTTVADYYVPSPSSTFSPRSVHSARAVCSNTSIAAGARKDLYGQPLAFNDGRQIPTDDKLYDYIVVGCGTSGCPLAATLAGNG